MYKILAKPFFIGKRIVYAPSCHSTNEIAFQLLKKGDVHDGMIVITNRQTAGKGQQGNSWEAQPEMNLTFSIILKPKDLDIENHFMLNVISSLAVRAFVANSITEAVTVKWPNDIYVGSSKIAGILIGNTLKTNRIESSVVGIGVNINQINFTIDNAISLKLCSGQHYLLGECLELIALEVEKYYFQYVNKSYQKLVSDYQKHLFWKDEVHTFQRNGQFFTGIIRGINDSGQLHIEIENGNEYFNFKEVSFVN